MLEIRLEFRQRAGDSARAKSGGRASWPEKGRSEPSASASSPEKSSLQPWSHQERTQRGGSVCSDTTSPSHASRTTHHIFPFAKVAAISFKQIRMHFKVHGKKVKSMRDTEIYDARLFKCSFSSCKSALELPPQIKTSTGAQRFSYRKICPCATTRCTKSFHFLRYPTACESVKNSFKAHLLNRSTG